MNEIVAVDDDHDAYPVIDTVKTLHKREVSNSEPDPFAQPAGVVKSLAGTNANFKRRVTNEIKKYNRSADGSVSSRQIEDVTEVTGYDALGVVSPPHNLVSLATLYALSSGHYAAVNAKVDNIVGLGFKLVETSKTKRVLEEVENNEKKLKRVRKNLNQHRDDLLRAIEEFNEEETFVEVLTKVWIDYETMGNGYIEVGRKRDGTIGYIGHIPAQTIRVRRQRDGFVQISGNQTQFFANFGAGASTEESGIRRVSNPIGNDRPNEIIHLKKYSPTSGFYGVPDIVAAQQAIAGNEFSSRFNLEYFENKAIPRHLITLKGAKLGPSAQADLLSFFETGLKGQNHRSLFIPLPPDGADGSKVEFKIEAVDTKVQESSFNNYRKSNLHEILMAHRVPISKVSTAEGASLAIARDADKTFKEQVVGPKQRVLEKKLNRIISEFTDAFELKMNEMTLTDEDTRSKINERYRKTGVLTGNEVRIEMGLQSISGGDTLVDLNDKSSKIDDSDRERDSARSSSATDSNGEGRSPKGEGRTDGTE